MTILVTGGAGFIGANFIFYMSKHHPEHRLVCLDKLTYAGNLATLASVMHEANFCFEQGDICDRQVVFSLFERERPEIVVNFAAESHVDRSIEHPNVFLQTNIIGTATLLDACRAYGIKRFHQVSTDEVYGELPLEQPELLFTEKTPLAGKSPYSSSKASADLLARSYYYTYNVPITISRCTNNYGPYQFPEKLIPRMILNALNNQELPVYGTGNHIRDWLHVEDHCKAIDLILQKGTAGEVYNIGGNNEWKNIDLIRLICKELGKSTALISFVEDRKGHDLRYGVDARKIQEQLGWHATMPFKEGLRKTIQWYQENKQWWSRPF